MEPQRNESARPESTPERKKDEKGRFRIVKLEERVAPKIGAGHTHGYPYCIDKHSK